YSLALDCALCPHLTYRPALGGFRVYTELLLLVWRDQAVLLFFLFFFFKQKTAYEIGLGIPAEPLFRSPFKALMFLTLMRPSLVLFLVLWLKLVKDFLKVRCRLALLPFLISCLIWLDLVASLPLIKERILVIILLLHFLSLMLGSV